MPRPKLDDVLDAVHRNDRTGFCLSCAAEVDGVEPDAEMFPCPVCGERNVSGAEIIIIGDDYASED